jgi:hypothetical protein
VDVFGRLFLAALLAQAALDPLLEFADRVDADAKLDEMKGHAALPK